MIRKYIARNEKETSIAQYYESELAAWKTKTEINQS
jgi:hypothetical protein